MAISEAFRCHRQMRNGGKISVVVVLWFSITQWGVGKKCQMLEERKLADHKSLHCYFVSVQSNFILYLMYIYSPEAKYSFGWIFMEILYGAKNGVHAFGYNSAESEPILMNSGALWATCLGLVMADFGRDPRSSDSLRGRRIFCFLIR